MKLKITSSKSLILLSAFCFATLICLLTLSNCANLQSASAKFPDDAKMEDNFRKHESDFKLLINMAEIDSKVVRIGLDFTWLDDDASYPRRESKLGFSNERWNEYRKLFGKLGLRHGLLRYPDSGFVHLIGASEGLVTGGKSKGYAYTTENLSPQFDSLDNLNLDSVNGNTAYKRIQDNWYLFLKWE